MEKEGKYIYCIISTNQERNFGPIGIGGRGDEVLTVGYEDLSMVVSSHPMSRIHATSDNLLAHEKVIEEVMKEFDSVLPVRLGTIAASAEGIRNILDRRCQEFKSALINMDHKIELGVKGTWRNMAIIFNEITAENKEIKEIKERLKREPEGKNIPAKMKAGEMVFQALAKKKDKEAEKVLDALRKIAVDYRFNKTFGGDEMFINAAFLVDKGREKEFDNIINDLDKEYKDRIKFIYAGPLPVFNFVNIVIHQEEWEK